MKLFGFGSCVCLSMAIAATLTETTFPPQAQVYLRDRDPNCSPITSWLNLTRTESCVLSWLRSST
jgi:hypothetical protein